LSASRARQDVKVAIIGQGPDELFGGYKRHLGVHYGGNVRGLPHGVQSLAAALVGKLPRNETLKRGVQSLGIQDRLERYQNVFSLVPGETVNGLFRDKGGQISGMVDYWKPCCRKWKSLMSLAASRCWKSVPRCRMSC